MCSCSEEQTDSLFDPAVSKRSLFDKCRKSGKLLELFIIAATAVITFIIQYSILMAISCVRCCACTEQKDSIFPKLFTSSLATICMASIIRRKKRSEEDT